jgi:hypothetical protein
MPAAQILNIVLTVVDFLLIIPGLWVAGKLLPKLIGWIKPVALQEQLSRPLPRLILWLGLGTLFTYPLLDLLGIVGSWPAFVTPSSGSFATAFGTVPGNSVTVFSIVIMVLIYLPIWWAGMRMLTVAADLDGVEKNFIVLLFASLVYRFISRGILGFLQLPVPSTVGFLGNLGTAGFLLAVVVGLVLLAVIVVGINMALDKQPMQDER